MILRQGGKNLRGGGGGGGGGGGVIVCVTVCGCDSMIVCACNYATECLLSV